LELTFPLCVMFILGSLVPLLALAKPAVSIRTDAGGYERYDTFRTILLVLKPYVRMAADVYVDGEHGNDADPGTADAPFKTITHALAAATATETEPVTIHVAGSTYSASQNGESFPLNVKSRVSLVGEGRRLRFSMRSSHRP